MYKYFLVFILIFSCFSKPSQEIESIDSKAKKYFNITQVELKQNDRIYRIHIAEPKNNSKRNKILYLLDGNAFFPKMLNLIVNEELYNTGRLPIIVGIGHDSNLAFDRKLRTYDYTPDIPKYLQYQYGENGGINEFHKFIANTLIPYMNNNYSIESSAIFGHSFGGLYVLYNAFNFPNDFRIFISASPSMTFGNGAIFPIYTPFLHNFNNHTLVITQGSLERINGNLSRENLYNTLLLQNPKNDIRFYDFFNKTHGGSIQDAMQAALKILIKQ